MAIRNKELMHGCFPKTLAHGDSKNEIRQVNRRSKTRGVSMERSKAAQKKVTKD